MVQDLQDKILTAVITLQVDVGEMKKDVKETKETIDLLYKKIDGFLVRIDRHEAEIAALIAARERIEERLEFVERKLGISPAI